MLKKLLSSVMVMLALFAAVPVFAATQSEMVPDTVVDVYVRNVAANQTSYKAGDEVTGSFDLINGSAMQSVSDVVYRISLAGGYKDGVIQTIYDTQTSNPLILAPGSHQHISYAYKLPAAFSGNLDIHIQAFLKSGTPLGWSDLPIKVTGGLPVVQITSSVITVNGTTFDLQAGPMVYPNATGTLTLSLNNPATSDVSVTPHIIIYDRTTTGAVKKDYTETQVTLKSKSTSKVSYELPTFNNIPGVYAGVLTFVDANSVARSAPIQFRYIVPGNIVTITSVNAAKIPLKEGDTLPIILNYTGSPFDIVTGNAPGDGNANLDVKVYNEVDQLVGEYQDTTNFNTSNTKTINLKAAVQAQALRADVVVTKDGKTLATYSAKLTPNFDELRQQTLATTPNSRVMNLIYGIIIVLAVIIILVVMKFWNTRRALPLAVLFALSFVGSYAGFHSVQAYNHTSVNAVWDYTYPYTNSPWWVSQPTTAQSQGALRPYPPTSTQTYPPSVTDTGRLHRVDCNSPTDCIDLSPQVTVNTPGAADRIAPGATFNFTGLAYAYACLNNPQDIVVVASFNGVTKISTSTNVNNSQPGATGHGPMGGTQFNLTGFTAPTTPGTYQLRFAIKSFTNVPGFSTNQNDYNRAVNPGTGSTYGSNSATVDVVPTVPGAGSVLGSGSDPFFYNPASTGGITAGVINVVVTQPTPVVHITASPNPVTSGNSTVLSWTTSNADACTLDDNGAGVVQNQSVSPTSGSTFTSPALTSQTIYTINCTNGSGAGSNSVTVNVTAAAPPSSGCTGPSGSGGLASGSGGSCGSGSPPPPPGNPPAVSLYGNRLRNGQLVQLLPGDTIPQGETAYLTWSSNNADSCVSVGPNSFSVPGTNQSGTNSPVNPTYPSSTYTLSCTNASGSASASITINVTNSSLASCDVDHTTATAGVTNVTWTATIPAGSTVTWSGDEISTSSPPTGTTYSLIYSTAGTKGASIILSPSGKVVGCSTRVNVKANPSFQEI